MHRKSFVVVRNSLLSLMICLSLACTTRNAAADARCPAIEMRAAANPQTDSGKTVTLVATGDIAGITASQVVDQWQINFTVTDDAAARVREFSKQHVGSNVDLVVDGKVQGTPRIAGEITGNKYRIDGLSRSDAERLAKAITDGCRR